MTPNDPPSYRPSGRRRQPPARDVRRVAGRDSAPRTGEDGPRDPQEPRAPQAAPGAPRRTSIRSSARDGVRRGAGGASTASAANARTRDPRPQVAAAASGWEDPAAQAGHTRMMPAAGHAERREREARAAYASATRPPEHAPAYAPRSAPDRGTQRPQRHPQPPRQAPPASPVRPARRRRPALRGALVFLLVLLIAWPAGLMVWANSRIAHSDPLSAGPATPGTTYLLAGSDSRADGTVADGTPGQRSDTILLLHKPTSGPTALVSLPRDTYVEIPGHGANKLNAAYAIGGPPLLASTVEELTGMGVDHYVEVGMGGVTNLVDAVDGVELCLDYDVQDEFSGLNWTAGCHEADGTVALQFARMRYSDPDGDIGRGARQRQVVGAVADEALSPLTLVNPVRQVRLVGAGTGALVTDPDTGILDLGMMALAFRSATGANGWVGAPPIASTNYQPGGIGSTVLLDRAAAPVFFDDLANGNLAPNQEVPPAG